MRVVLLGGSGFIGRHLANALASSAEVIAVSRNSPNPDTFERTVTHLRGDCTSEQFLRKIILPGDHLVFLAYNSLPKTSYDDPLRDIQENLPLAINLLNVVREIPIARLLYVSSGGTVYGQPETDEPIDEFHPTNPISPYGITKLSIEKYCQMYQRLFGIPLVIARPANPYGPLQEPDRGQGFIATACAKILRREEVAVFGSHGTIRDYLYVEDLVNALATLLTGNVPLGAIYNVGSGIGMNNLDLLHEIATVLKFSKDELKIQTLPTRPFDVTYNVLNYAKLSKLGWRPAIGIREGLVRTVSWLAERL